LDAGRIAPYAGAIFEAYWGDLRDISQDAVLADVVARVGLDREAFFAAIGSPAYKDRLAAASARRRCSSTATTCTSATTGSCWCGGRCGRARRTDDPARRAA